MQIQGLRENRRRDPSKEIFISRVEQHGEGEVDKQVGQHGEGEDDQHGEGRHGQHGDGGGMAEYKSWNDSKILMKLILEKRPRHASS